MNELERLILIILESDEDTINRIELLVEQVQQ